MGHICPTCQREVPDEDLGAISPDRHYEQPEKADEEKPAKKAKPA